MNKYLVENLKKAVDYARKYKQEEIIVSMADICLIIEDLEEAHKIQEAREIMEGK